MWLLGPLYASLIGGSYVPVAASLVSREALERTGPFDELLPFVEDRDLFIRLSREGRVAHVPAVLAETRRHDDNSTHPRFAHRTMLSRHRVLVKMWRSRDALALSGEERAATRSAFGPTTRSLLYATSREGLWAYSRSWWEVVRGFPHLALLDPRHLARAALRSTLGGPGRL